MTAWLEEEVSLATSLREALRPVQDAWTRSLLEAKTRLDRAQTEPRGFHSITEDSILRELAFEYRAPAALAGAAALDKNFVPKCSICDGSRSALAGGRLRVEALLVPSPRILEAPPATPDLAEVERALEALEAHRVRLPGILTATEAGRVVWQRLVDEDGALERILDLVRAGLAGAMAQIEAIDPEGAARLARGFAAEKEKMDRAAQALYGRKVCWFCTAGTEGVCHSVER